MLAPRRLLLVLLLAAAPGPALAQSDAGPTGAYLAAQHAFAARDYAAAASYYDRVLAHDDAAPGALGNALFAHLALGDMEAALRKAGWMEAQGIDSDAARIARLVDRFEAQDYETMLARLDDGAHVLPVINELMRGWTQLAAGRPDAARDIFDALGTRGLRQIGDYHAALALASQGQLEAAAALMDGGGDDPLHFTARTIKAHAQMLAALGQGDAALALLADQFGRDAPPEIDALVTALESGEAVHFDIVRSPRDGLAEAFFDVAAALEREVEPEDVLIYMRVSEYLRPDHTDALLATAQLLNRIGRHDLAETAFARVAVAHPGYHRAEIGRAESLHAAGEVEAALDVLDALADSHGALSQVHESRGDILRREERFAEAARAYDRAIDRIAEPDRRHWPLFYTRGISHEREDRWDAAEADFRRALELEPDQPDVLNYLGYSLLERGADLDEAHDMIERAHEARPDSGHITDSLGWVLFRKGRPQEALPHMERAAELLPDDPIVNDHLGDVYWALDRRLEAEFQWRRALSFDPEPEDAERIRRKLDIGLDAVLAEEGETPGWQGADSGG